MSMLPQFLAASSAFILLLLGSVHLLYTFNGMKLHPRDHAVRLAMEGTSLVLTGQTTMWRAWIGFNASHSFGAMLFGLVYGYLALLQPNVLFGSIFLPSVGLAFLGSLLFLARTYWFSIPYWGVLLSGLLFVAALVIRLA